MYLLLFQVKNAAKTEFYKGAGRLVTEALLTLPPELRVPNSSSLERAANRARETLRPKHPTTLDFEVCIFILPFKLMYCLSRKTKCIEIRVIVKIINIHSYNSYQMWF